MIAKCSPIPHGATAMDYNNKKEKAELVAFHGLPANSNEDNYWSRMMDFQLMKRMEIQAWKPLKNTALRFELSPENKYTETWTLADWHQLALDFIRELDSIDRRPPKEGKKQCALKPTNLQNSQYVITLHHDSKSGIRHLHILANRVDLNGYTNDAHYIGERAVDAANRVTRQRGWDLATDRRAVNIEEIHKTAIDVLKEMPRFDWTLFVQKMNAQKYDVQLKTDKDGNVRGMSIKKGHSVYKSSELGHGRDLMPSKIEATWRKLHKADQKVVTPTETKLGEPKQSSVVTQPVVSSTANNTVPEKSESKMGSCTIPFGEKSFVVPITKEVFEQLAPMLHQEMETQNAETDVEINNVAKVALLLFGMYVDAATDMSESIGGGGGTSSNWGKKDDEDDLMWLRRCARQAVWMCKPIQRSRTR